jgi:hypothetical protein
MSPKGFWSYARGDDDHLDGVLSELRKRIAGEVSMLLGLEVGIFQDIHGLHTGDRWADKLRAEVSKASFLIPVLTPLFFNRKWCRDEVLTYLRLSKEKGVEPRIFPIRFVKWDDQDDCEVRAALEPFQYKDLSQWRFENDPTKRERLINEFAEDVKARLKLAPVPRATPKVIAEATARNGTAQVPIEKPASGPKYETYVVDPFPGRGDFTSIGAAIEAAEPGAKIVVREGTYREALKLSKPLEIVGEGDRERILVVTDQGDSLHCDAPMARVSGMRFRREAGGLDCGIWILGGAVEIDDCVVESLSSACVAISGAGSRPTLRRCVLRQGAGVGLHVCDGAEPVVEDCEMLDHVLAGGEVSGGETRATLRRCIARDCKGGGYYFHDGAGGIMERCEAVGNAFSGVEIRTVAAPNLRDCIIRNNQRDGIVICDGGSGWLQDCEIAGNGRAGVVIQQGGAPLVSGCTITDNILEAVRIEDSNSGGEFRFNDLHGNGLGAWCIADGAKLERVDNKE